MALEISNCFFGYECSQKWEDLIESDTNVRYCPKCSEDVYLCTTPKQLMQAIKKSRCVAVDVIEGGRVKRTMGDMLFKG